MKLRTHVASGLVVLAILWISLCGNAEPPQSAPPSSHTAAQKLALEGVENFAEIAPTLYRGGQPSRVGYEALARMGVNIVVDARLSGIDKERKDVEKAGMQYVSIPWHCLFPKDDVFARFLALLRDNPGKKIFVHCRYGDDRTGMMIASYRMSVEGWNADEALREMDLFGFHHVVCHSLVPYERDFPERLRQDPAFRAPGSTQPAAN